MTKELTINLQITADSELLAVLKTLLTSAPIKIEAKKDKETPEEPIKKVSQPQPQPQPHSQPQSQPQSQSLISDSQLVEAISKASSDLMSGVVGLKDMQGCSKAFIKAVKEIAKWLEPGCKPTQLPAEKRQSLLDEVYNNIRLDSNNMPYWERI